MERYASEEAAAEEATRTMAGITERKKAREEEEAMLRYAQEEAAPPEAGRAMAERIAERIAERKRELAERRAREEEAMSRYAQEEAAPPEAGRAMAERIAPRKRELAERKAREEGEGMARYAQEEGASEAAAKEMAERIAARKRELAERKAREEAEAMSAYCQEEAAAPETARALAERIEARKRELEEKKAREEAAAGEAAKTMAERIAARQRELAERMARVEEEAMERYFQEGRVELIPREIRERLEARRREETEAGGEARVLREKIAAKKRKLEERKREGMTRYQRAEKDLEDMKWRIHWRKKGVAEEAMLEAERAEEGGGTRIKTLAMREAVLERRKREATAQEEEGEMTDAQREMKRRIAERKAELEARKRPEEREGLLYQNFLVDMMEARESLEAIKGELEELEARLRDPELPKKEGWHAEVKFPELEGLLGEMKLRGKKKKRAGTATRTTGSGVFVTPSDLNASGGSYPSYLDPVRSLLKSGNSERAYSAYLKERETLSFPSFSIYMARLFYAGFLRSFLLTSLLPPFRLASPFPTS
jgi:hypothetical protein